MRKKIVFVFILLISASSAAALYFFDALTHLNRPAITYFPEDNTIRYLSASTHLRLSPDQKLDWMVESHTSQRAYLRQDFSLLYKNNRLFATLNQWKRDESLLTQKKRVNPTEGIYQSISFHHTEIHKNGAIFGKDQQTIAQIIAGKKDNRLKVFTQAETPWERDQLDLYLERMGTERSTILRQAAQTYRLDLSNYRVLSLFDLEEAQPFAVFDKKTARRITSQLWEGLYQSFLRGLQINEGQFEPIIGSSMPLILIAEDHLLILIKTEKGEIVLLKQNF